MNNPASASRGCLSHYNDGTFRAGDIVVAAIRNPFENSNSKGKNRPFVLVRRVDGHWLGMGLTTSSRYASGAPRLAIPDPAAAGLRGPGFLWGDRLTSVSVLDMQCAIGTVTPSLADAVISLAGLGGADSESLREASLRRRRDHELAL